MGLVGLFLAIKMSSKFYPKELPLNLGQSSPAGLLILMALITIPIPIAITTCAITLPLNLCVPKNLGQIYFI